MMFVVRSAGARPQSASVQIKAERKPPEAIPSGAGKIDFFCIGDAEAMHALRAKGWDIVDLRDGWYAGDHGGGIAIFGHGRYWEIRDTLFTVVEACGPGGASTGASKEGEHVEVRRAIFGV
jgi:hypothetical protein